MCTVVVIQQRGRVDGWMDGWGWGVWVLFGTTVTDDPVFGDTAQLEQP